MYVPYVYFTSRVEVNDFFLMRLIRFVRFGKKVWSTSPIVEGVLMDFVPFVNRP